MHSNIDGPPIKFVIYFYQGQLFVAIRKSNDDLLATEFRWSVSGDLAFEPSRATLPHLSINNR